MLRLVLACVGAAAGFRLCGDQSLADCALRVRVLNGQGSEAAIGRIVLRPLQGGESIFAPVVNGEASICDFDFGPHELIATAGQDCPVATVSPVFNEWQRAQVLTVMLPPCPTSDGASGGNSCRILVRVRDVGGSAVPDAAVQVGASLPRMSTDQFGRAVVISRVGIAQEIVARRDRLEGHTQVLCTSVSDVLMLTIRLLRRQ